jgi:hypothetical protein
MNWPPAGSRPDQVLAAVGRIAERAGWPMDWLNTDAQMYGPDPDYPEPGWEVLIERDGVIVEVGTAALLLAMKLHAARGLRDTADIEVLVSRCGLTSVNEAIELYEAHYRADPLANDSRRRRRLSSSGGAVPRPGDSWTRPVLNLASSVLCPRDRTHPNRTEERLAEKWAHDPLRGSAI